MMKITKNIDGSTLTFALEGRLDSNTAPEFETEIKTSLNGISNLILDFEKLVYISSAGLRVGAVPKVVKNDFCGRPYFF